MLIGAWLLFSSLHLNDRYIPTPGEIINTFLTYQSVLIKHLGVTFRNCIIGFITGLALATIACLIVINFNKLQRLFSLFALVIYSIPLIAMAPIAALLFESHRAGFVLGAISSFLPIYLTGLKYATNISLNLKSTILVFGGNDRSIINYLRIPYMERGLFIGAQSGWLWAVLGTLLGEFAGSQWGLGNFLIGSIVQGSPAKVWLIALLCLFISALGLFFIRVMSRRLIIDSSFDPIDITEANLPDAKRDTARLLNPLNIFILLLIWQIASWLIDIPGGVFSSPIDLVKLVSDISQGNESFTMGFLSSAIIETMKSAFLGLIASLALAYSLAVAFQLYPLPSRLLIIILLITQVTPIVAFIPFIALALGRSTSAIILIVIFSTIYPSYSVFINAFKSVSKNAINVAQGFGASKYFILSKIQIPGSLQIFPIAFRLAIGRALLGAITGEYLLSGQGLGGLLGLSRAQLNFSVVWLICAIVASITLLIDLLIVQINSYLTTRKNKK